MLDSWVYDSQVEMSNDTFLSTGLRWHVLTVMEKEKCLDDVPNIWLSAMAVVAKLQIGTSFP